MGLTHKHRIKNKKNEEDNIGKEAKVGIRIGVDTPTTYSDLALK